MTKSFYAAAIVAISMSTALPATAQTAGQLAQMRTACSVGQGNCLAFVQAFIARPAFTTLAAGQRAQIVGVLAAELREIGVSVADEVIDVDVEASLRELAVVTPDEDQANQIVALVEEIRQDDDDTEVPTGQFSDN